jgi:Tol biopolymer transport system component
VRAPVAIAISLILGALLSASAATSGDHGSSAPRNGKIAFSISDHPDVQGKPDIDLCLMNPNGSGRKRLTRAAGSDVEARWRPDGRRLAFVRDDTPRIVGESEGRDSRIYVLRPDGTMRRLSLPPTQWPGDHYPSWSPDGLHIVFNDIPWRLAQPSVWSMRWDGSGRRLLLANAIGPVWAPDGTIIALEGIDLVEPDGSGRRHFVAGSSPAWSPDSQRLAFVRFAGGSSDISIVNRDGSGQRVLVADGADPAWSPDGTKIAFVRDGDIWVVDTDGSNGRRLTRTSGADESDPAWQPAIMRGSANAWARGRRAC